MNLISLDTIDSTNDEAKRRLRAAIAQGSGAEQELFESAITARKQTAGKGRRGKSFHSPDTGDSLYISFILPPPTQHRSLELLTVAAAVAVSLTVEEILADSDDTEQRPSIKWVNDVMINNKKICGILAESVASDGAGTSEPTLYAIVLGIGININMREDDFPEELRGIAGSLLLDEYGHERISEILCKNMLGIYKDMESGNAGSVLDLYRKFESTTGHKVRIMKHVMSEDGKYADNRAIFAFAKAIADDGGLVVVYDDGSEEVLRSGEISVRDCGEDSTLRSPLRGQAE